MAKKQDIGSPVIPSEMKAVTEYEREFIDAWKDNTANAVGELLSYVASATAVAIKKRKE